VFLEKPAASKKTFNTQKEKGIITISMSHSWCSVLINKLKVDHLVKKFKAVMKSEIITMLIRAHKRILSPK
jgi:hypothetical protein